MSIRWRELYFVKSPTYFGLMNISQLDQLDNFERYQEIRDELDGFGENSIDDNGSVMNPSWLLSVLLLMCLVVLHMYCSFWTLPWCRFVVQRNRYRKWGEWKWMVCTEWSAYYPICLCTWYANIMVYSSFRMIPLFPHTNLPHLSSNSIRRRWDKQVMN